MKVGDIIAAPFENDNTWYRAKVMEIKGTELDLFYVDYGDSCFLDVSECKSGRFVLLIYPCPKVRAGLAGQWVTYLTCDLEVVGWIPGRGKLCFL